MIISDGLPYNGKVLEIRQGGDFPVPFLILVSISYVFLSTT